MVCDLLSTGFTIEVGSGRKRGRRFSSARLHHSTFENRFARIEGETCVNGKGKRMLKWSACFVRVSLLGSALSIAACSADMEVGDDQGTSEEDLSVAQRSRAAEVAFFSAFNSGDYGRVPWLISQFDQSQAPPRVEELKAFSEAWGAAESTRSGLRTPAEYVAKTKSHAEATIRILTDLREKRRVDPSVSIVDLSLGLSYLTLARIARASGDLPAAQGNLLKAKASLDEGVKQNPFNSLLPRAAVNANLARTPAAVEPSLNDFVRLFNDCLKVTPSLTRETITTLTADQMRTLEGLASEPGTVRACANSAKAPHNVEGTFLFLGDVFAKAGNERLAIQAYRSAERVSTYSRWTQRGIIAERLATVGSRVRSYQLEPVEKQPLVGPAATVACATCHVK